MYTNIYYAYICIHMNTYIYIHIYTCVLKIPRTVPCTFHELYHLYVTADEACKFHELCILHITPSALYPSRTLSRHPNGTNSVFYILRTVSCTYHGLYPGIQMSRTLSFTYHNIFHELYPAHITNSIIYTS